MRRRTNPYSRRSEIEGSRQQFWSIVALVLAAGLLINLSSGWLTLLLQRHVIRGNTRTEAIVYGLLFLVLLAIVGLFIFIYHSRAEASKCRMEVALPYCFSREDGLQIKNQHRFRPLYAAATAAQQLFDRAYRQNKKERVRLAAEWLDAPKGKRPQAFLSDIHPKLIDALILQALHKYTEDSIGKEAIYDWYKVELEPRLWSFAELPARLRQNQYIVAQQADAKDWVFLLPKDIDLAVETNQEGWVWRLHHARYGDVRLQCYAPPSTRAQGQAAEIFKETYFPRGNKQPPRCDELWVLGTRILATASFSRTLVPGVDPFHQWATRMLTYLEDALDWGAFLEGRSARVVNDLPWKIGDLPTKDDSIWQKLEAIEKRLAQLEKKE